MNPTTTPNFFCLPLLPPSPQRTEVATPEHCCSAGQVESQAKCTGPQPSCLASRRSWLDLEAVVVQLRPLERVGENLGLEEGVRHVPAAWLIPKDG